jgi:serine/threonine protein kinase
MIEAGQKLLHYRLVEKIGAGGMGEVYVAEDAKLHRRVALKVLPGEMAADPERRERFQREARSVAALNHPNIVTVHSVEEAEGVHFITMELVEGKTLTEMLPRKGFPTSRLLEIAIPLTDAVSSAHRAGITHRDLKPDNVMIDDGGRLRVLDFGLAKLHDPTGTGEEAETASAGTGEGRILGTVAYMSPEQAEGKPVDPRSDVFSLGTIVYEMATGERPFRGDTSMSTIGAILKDHPAPVTDRNPSLPRHLGRIVRRCLAKEPDRRYQSALDLRNELEELKAEIDSGELMSEPRAVAARSRRGSKIRIVLGIGAVIAAAAVLAIMLRTRPDAPATLYTSRPITATVGWKGDLNWSPESEFIAYSKVVAESLDVVVQPVAGGDAVVRAGGPGDEATPRWSPDGRYLAYISTSEPGSFVFLVPPHGGSPRRLIETNLPALDIDMITQAMGDRPWSSDGRTLLLSRVTPSGQLAVYRVDRDNGDAEQLTSPPVGSDDFGASYSFDGERIVFQRRTHGRGSLLTMPAAGGDPEVLLADEFENMSPAWRPDNRRVVFRSTRGGGVRLWEIDVMTGSLSEMTFGTKGVWGVSVSADDRIAYIPYWHDTFLFTVDVETGERRQLTSHTEDNFGARLSPGGGTVAYHSTRTGNSEIWLHHLDGRPETRVTDHPNWDLYPEWSPDGRRLLFASNRDGPFKVFTSNSDGGDVRLLVDQPISLRSPLPVNAELVCRWSPDGGRIAYLVAGHEGGALWTVRPDGGGARKVLDNVAGFDWYRDSGHAICTRQRGSENELIAVDLETGQEQVLFVGPLMEIDVAPDGSAVAFCFGRGHLGMGLARLRLEPPSNPGGLPHAIGEPEFVVPAEKTWHVHNGGWSADSKTLVYTRDMDFANIYELVERR